jgi:hypothetical protein
LWEIVSFAVDYWEVILAADWWEVVLAAYWWELYQLVSSFVEALVKKNVVD